MSIPVERVGSEKQKIPAVLYKIEKSLGFIKYGPRLLGLKVSLSELQFAPSAFAASDDIYSHTMVGITEHSVSNVTEFNPRTTVDVWLPTEATVKINSDRIHDGTTSSGESSLLPTGAWWPGRLINVQGEFARVEVAAPIAEHDLLDDLTSSITSTVLRMGSAVLPYRSALVKLNELRQPWNGIHSSSSADQDGLHLSMLLSTPNGLLQRHTICIPAYLTRLATSVDTHSGLVKFCGAPCLIQCDPEPFLANVMAKRILSETDSMTNSGRQTPTASGSEVDSFVPSVVDSKANSLAFQNSSIWPPAHLILQSTLLSIPTIAGTLSPFGITDPALLLEGLPGANGPLVFLHIWSASREAIRRATLLELAHVRILVFRYHVVRKMSHGEPGDLELADSTDNPVENGDTPTLHCKPITIPSHPNAHDLESDAHGNNDLDNRMIGYSAQFRIQPHLIGLAIGSRGSTIQEARTLPGVRVVDLLQDGVIYVEAETIDGCHAVYNLLDFTETEIPVPPRLASRLIGSKGLNIRKLAASAGVRRAQLLDPLMRKKRQQKCELMKRRLEQHQPYANSTDLDAVATAIVGNEELEGKEKEDSSSPAELVTNGAQNIDSNKDTEKLPSPAFYILGTRASVAKMRLLLEFQADNWNELDELEETRRSLFTQLRQSNQPIMTKSAFVTSGVDSSVVGSASQISTECEAPLAFGSNAPHADPRQHQPPFRPRNRGGMSNGSGRILTGSQRSNRLSESGSTSVSSSGQHGAPSMVNGMNGWTPQFGQRGRGGGGGRFRQRNQSIPTS